MSRATPQMRHFAKRLMAHECRKGLSSKANTPAALWVCDKLRSHLATLMGSAGFHALISRALALALPQSRWVRALHLRSDGSVEERDELVLQLDSADIDEGSVILLAELLALLTAFIGESLTAQMTRQVWPTLSLKDSRFWKRIAE